MADNPTFEMKVISKEGRPPESGSGLTMSEVTPDFNKMPDSPRDMYTGSNEDDDNLGLKPAKPAYQGGEGAQGPSDGVPRALPPPYQLPGSHNPSAPVSVWHTGQNTTVVVNQPMARPGPVTLLDADVPIPTKCYNCGERIVTYLYYDSGSCTWVSCMILMVIGCDLGCCLVPFCFDYFKDAYHKCPNCHVVLGKHRKLGC